MSAVYDSFKSHLLTWLLNGGTPTGVTFYVAGVDDGYVFNGAHSAVSDLGAHGVIDAVELTGVTTLNGVIDADDVSLVGITPGPTLQGLVVFAGWGAGSALICFIDGATDASLPQELITGKLNIQWAVQGICKI